jgi:hypothetical protein
MKPFLFITFLIISSFCFAQDSTNVIDETPKIASKLAFGETLKFNDIELKFVAVISDSRCPKGVTCVRAGEIIILVDVFKNGKKVEQKELQFTPTSHLQNRIANLFASKDLNVFGYNVLPYPEYGNKIKSEDYYIQLNVRR